jgi:hypothetical protein
MTASLEPTAGSGGVTPERVVRLAADWYPDCADNEHTMLRRLRAQAPSFVPTWLSALAATGIQLPPRLAAEVAESRERTALLGDLLAALRGRFPSATAVKGTAVAAGYPPSLARHMNDIDLVVPDDPTLWQLADYLRTEHGLSVVKSLVRIPLPDGPALLVSLEAWPDGPLRQRVNVEIASAGWIGNGADVPGRHPLLAARYGPVEHLAMIVAERLEGALSPKEIVDAAVLGAQLDRAEARRLVELVTELQVLPEYRELHERVAAAGFRTGLLEVPAAAARAQRQRRRGAAVRRAARHPVAESLRQLQRAEIFDGRAQTVRIAAWRAIERRIPVQAPIRDRLWGFGSPARRIDPTLRAGLHTPLGDFVMVNGSTIGGHWQRTQELEFDV